MRNIRPFFPADALAQSIQLSRDGMRHVYYNEQALYGTGRGEDSQFVNRLSLSRILKNSAFSII